MVEYLYDCIRAVPSQDIVINAYITDEQENIITENCKLVVYNKDANEMLFMVEGVYLPESLNWEFTIPANATSGRDGRYWYSVQHNNKSLCFKQPIYLER